MNTSPLPPTKPIAVKYDDTEITLSEGYINALKNLMREEILMMREVYKNSEDWVIGTAKVEDLANNKGSPIYVREYG